MAKTGSGKGGARGTNSGGPVGISFGSPGLLLLTGCHLMSPGAEDIPEASPTWESEMGLEGCGKRGRPTRPCVAGSSIFAHVDGIPVLGMRQMETLRPREK